MNSNRRFVSSVSSLSLLASFALLASCGGAPPPAAAPMPKGTAVIAPTVDLSPVPEPEGLVAIAHMGKPNDAIKTVTSWVHLPMVNAAMLLQSLGNDDIVKAIDLSQSVDMAVTVQGEGMSIKPQGAVAAAIKSFDEAKTAFGAHHKLVAEANGALRVVGLTAKGAAADEDSDGKADADDVDETPCAIAHAAGAANARLVCADSLAALQALMPYLTRTAPRATYTSDVHIEFRPAPLRSGAEALRKMIPLLTSRLSSTGVSSAGADALKQLSESALNDLADLASDVDKLTLDGSLGSDDVTITSRTSFATKTSLVARLSVAHPERADAPPAAFWRLPGDATSASYGRSVDVQELAHARDLAKNALLALLEKAGIVEADRRALTDALHHTIDRALEAQVTGHGVDMAAVTAAAAAVKANTDDKKSVANEHALVEALMGWTIIATDTPAPKVAATVHEAIAAWNRPGVAKWTKDAAGSLDASIPKIVARDAGPVKGAPKGATHFVIEISPKEASETASATHTKKKGHATVDMDAMPKTKKHAPLVVHGLVVADGTQTWVVIAGDEALAAQKATLVATGAPEATLAKRAGLDVFHDVKANGGFFITPIGSATESPFVVWSGMGKSQSDPFRGVAELADKGLTPLPFTVTTFAAGPNGAAGSSVVTAKVPRAAIEDVAKMVMRGGFD